jgi:hypothetical protein
MMTTETQSLHQTGLTVVLTHQWPQRLPCCWCSSLLICRVLLLSGVINCSREELDKQSDSAAATLLHCVCLKAHGALKAFCWLPHTCHRRWV